MSQYIEEISGRHPSKRSVFRNECSECGKPLRRNAKNKIGYICRKCGPRRMNTEDSNSACYYCPFEQDCTRRVQLGIWIRCETPDIADLERLRFTGGLNNDRVRAEVEKALANCGNRQVLEKEISQSTPKVYQDVVEGKERQISVGIRDEL
jgi:hypothetical protein